MRWIVGVGLMMAGVVAGCRPEPPADPYAARVGQQVLTHGELSALVEQAVAGQDTVALRQVLVEQWVADALLFDAAQRGGVLQDEEIRSQIERNTRAIASAAFLDQYFEEHTPTFTDEQIAAYFDSHGESLQVREPYVEYRLFRAPTDAEVRRARSALTRRGGVPDTLWQAWPRRDGYTIVPLDAAPERGLFATVPEVRDVLLSLAPGQTSGVIEADSAFYVVQVVSRVPEGGPARLAWVRPEIEQRLMIDARKQMARRLVQTLRAEAIARSALDIAVGADTLQ